MNERLDRFTKLLKEIFELDKSDLDFGIYRVMNLRKAQIEQFLTERLPQMVQETLAPFAQGSKEEIRAKMKQIEDSVSEMGMTVDALPDTAQKKQQYGDVLSDEIHPDAPNQVIVGELKCFVPNEQGSVTLSGSKDNPVIAVWPIDDEGVERKWRYAYQSIGEIYDYLKAETSRKGNYQIKMPKYSDQFKTLWSDSRYNAGDYGTKVLTGMGFTKEDFEYPKSVYTVKDCVYAISRKDSIVFDYFAGSGTTAQAVMLLNKEDKGTRKFILVEMGTYFDRVTVPRVKKSMYASGIKSWESGKPQVRNDSTNGIFLHLYRPYLPDARRCCHAGKTAPV